MRLTPDEEFEMMEAIYMEALRNRQDAIDTRLGDLLIMEGQS